MLAGRTTALDASRCMDTDDHKRSQPSQQKPAARNKVAHVEGLRGLARPVTVIYRNQQRKKTKNIFCLPKKKEQSQQQNNNDDFRKVVISK